MRYFLSTLIGGVFATVASHYIIQSLELYEFYRVLEGSNEDFGDMANEVLHHLGFWFR